MALETGTRFGPYEILAPAGAGGMGEVHRARDVRAHYAVSADGQRFLVHTVDASDRGAPIQVVVNWPAGASR